MLDEGGFNHINDGVNKPVTELSGKPQITNIMAANCPPVVWFSCSQIIMDSVLTKDIVKHTVHDYLAVFLYFYAIIHGKMALFS